MSKAYKVVKRKVMIDKSHPYEGYTVIPVNYGVLTTEEVQPVSLHLLSLSGYHNVLFLAPGYQFFTDQMQT